MEDFVLVRASEIALERGYPGFQVIRVQDESGYTETTSKAKTTIEKTPMGAEITHHPAETTRWEKPGVTIHVRLRKTGRAIDAREVNQRLARRYSVPETSDEDVPEAPDDMDLPPVLDNEAVAAAAVEDEVDA